MGEDKQSITTMLVMKPRSWRRTGVTLSNIPSLNTSAIETFRQYFYQPPERQLFLRVSSCGGNNRFATNLPTFMAAIGRFQKGEEILYAKVVDGELFRLRGDVFGSPSFDKKPTPFKGLRTLTPVAPTKVIAVGLNYADHARESGKPLPKEPLFWLK